MWWNRCSSAARVQSLAVARRIASAHLCSCKWLMPEMDCTTRCLNPGSLTEGERQSASVMPEWKEQIQWYSADVHRRGIFSLGGTVWSNRWGWMGTKNKSCFGKGVMTRWHKLSWEGRKVRLHKNWKTEWIYIFSKQLNLYLKNSFKKVWSRNSLTYC